MIYAMDGDCELPGWAGWPADARDIAQRNRILKWWLHATRQARVSCSRLPSPGTPGTKKAPPRDARRLRWGFFW